MEIQPKVEVFDGEGLCKKENGKCQFLSLVSKCSLFNIWLDFEKYTRRPVCCEKCLEEREKVLDK